MMDATDQSPPSQHCTKVPIAQLSPALEPQQDKCIAATVTLVWPYSSSTKSLSLLLAEPDFRLRRSHGQVKAIFHGRVAEKVAGSQVGIGDSIRLSMKDASFVPNDTAVQTPGRYAAWDIHFNNGVSLEINPSTNALSTVFITEHTEPQEPELLPPSTPRVASVGSEAVETLDQATWKSPAFFKSSPNNFGGLLGSRFDPFTEDDGFVPGKGRKRPRYSFQRADWRVLDEPLSPQETEAKEPWEDGSLERNAEEEEEFEHREPEPAAHAQSEDDLHAADVPDKDQASSMQDASREESAVFVKPSLEVTGSMFGRRAQEPDTATQSRMTTSQDTLETQFHLPTDTPQLRPIPSPGLPIPSPIVSGASNGQGYFGGFHTSSQAHNIQAISSAPPPHAQFPALAFPDDLPPVSRPQMSLTGGDNVTRADQDDETIFSPSALVNHQFPDTPSGTSFKPGEMPMGQIASHEPPTLTDEKQFTEPDVSAVQSTIEGDLETIPQDVEERSGTSGEDVDDYAEDSAEDGAEEKIDDGDDAISESEESNDEAVYEHVNQGPRAHPGITTGAQVAIDIEAFEDEQEDDASDNISSQGDLTDAFPIPEHNGQHDAPSHPLDDSQAEIDPADEDALNDDAASEYESQYEYDDEGNEYEAQAEESSDKDSESAPLSRPQSSQPEIIVLDSDSEDELASDQPVPPQPASLEYNDDHGSFSMSETMDSEAGEDEDEWLLSQTGAQAAEAEFPSQERVNDSDLEDESFVGIPTRDHYPEQDSMRESSVEEEAIDRVEDAGMILSDGQDVNGDSGREISPTLTTGLTTAGHQARRASVTSQHEDQLTATRQGQDTSGNFTRHYYVLDGADDRDQPQQHPGHFDIDDRAGAKHKTLNLDNVSNSEPQNVEASDEATPEMLINDIDPGLVKPAEQQLPTPDPTQEVVSDQTPAFRQLQPGPRQSTSGLNISLDSAQDIPGEQTMLVTDEIVQENIPNQNMEGVDGVVTLPSSEPIENETMSPGPTRGKAPEATAVLISNTLVPNRHAPGLRSKYAYFAPLATAIDHYNVLVDTISIINEVSPIARATSRPKDYFVTIQLTDPSMAGTSLQAQIFRRYKSAMPSVSQGDAVLLRDFKVCSYDHSIMLVSVDSSSWAVFDGSSHDAQVNGPPVEYGPEERAYASGLRKWYIEIGADMVADHQLQAMVKKDNMDRESSPESAVGSDVGSMDSSQRSDITPLGRGSRRSRRSHRRVTIHELRDGTRYTEVGSPSSKESIHELRDGTVYANL